MILRTVSESSTIITSGCVETGATRACGRSRTARSSPCGSNFRMSARPASCTGLMISTISPVPSTVAPEIPETRASCGPMFFTTTSWLPTMSSTWTAAWLCPLRSNRIEL